MGRAVVYLRFPRNRNGFKDPPIVEWNAQKEKELWNMLKSTSTDLEWHELARHFNVSLVYILQQAAWLYEKELGVLRKRMSRISTSLPPNDTATPPPAAASSSQRNLDKLDTSIRGTLLHNGQSVTSSPIENNSFSVNNGSDSVGSSDGDDTEFSSRRLLSTSRLLESDNESDYSESSLDGFLPTNNNNNNNNNNDDDNENNNNEQIDTMSSSSESTVSQSALEAALMEQSSQSETSGTI